MGVSLPAESGNHATLDAGHWIHARRTVLPKRLVGPGPEPAELAAIFGAAAAAPDHGQLLPWRFVLVPLERRDALADVFEQALVERDAAAEPEQRAQAREKAYRAPVVALLVVHGGRGDPAIDWNERLISAGCAVQNVLLMATSLGFGSSLTSGKAMMSSVLRRRFGLHEHEQAVCFVSVGSVASSRPDRPRPTLSDYLSVLE
ncbi:MAG: nitroreductase family protein [Burkholderiaceae bacterium]